MRTSSKKTVLKRVLAYVLAIALTLSVVSVPSTDAYAASGSVKSVTITNVPTKQITLKKGKTFTVKTKIVTTGKISKAVAYKSSNSKVAKVAANGKITAVKNGSATITVYAKANKKKASSIKVTVGTPVSSVKMSKSSISLSKGASYTLKATISPSSASNKALTWKSSNTKVATVSAKGVVKAVGAGTAKITATAKDGSKKYAVSTVKVTIPVSSVKLDKTSLEIFEGKEGVIKATVLPSNASNKTVKWTTSDESVAKVVNGTVTGIKAGQATITATASGKKAVCTVTVNPVPIPDKNVEEITLKLVDNAGNNIVDNAGNNTLYVGQKAFAVASVTPDDATNKVVEYSVSDENYATINSKTGEIVAVKEGGPITIKASATDKSGKFATISLNIKNIPTVSFKKDVVTLYDSNETTLQLTEPNIDVELTSSNPNVVEVVDSKLLKIKGVGIGEAEITVKRVDYPEATDVCKVVVKDGTKMVKVEEIGVINNGIVVLQVSMADKKTVVTNDILKNNGSVIYLVNTETNAKVTARYSENSLETNENGDLTARYIYESSDISKKGTYRIEVPESSILVVDGLSDYTVQVKKVSVGIAGNVEYIEDGEYLPVEGAKVSFFTGEDRNYKDCVYTDNSGHYEISLDTNAKYSVTVSKSGYFDTTSDSYIVVSSSSVTSYNTIMNSVDDSKRVLYGHIDLNEGDLAKLSHRPTATLYLDGEDGLEKIDSVTVSKQGYYVFMNNNGYSDFIYDTKYSTYIEDYNYSILGDNKNYNLNPDNKYKIVISDRLTSDNNDCVYESQVIPVELKKEEKTKKADDVTLTKVQPFKGLTIPGEQIRWGDNCDSVGETANIRFRISAKSSGNVSDAVGSFTKYITKTVSLKNDPLHKKSDNELVTVLEPNEYCLPAGDYYVRITNVGNSSVTDIYKSFTVDNYGTAKEITDVEFGKKTTFSVNIRLDVDDAYITSEKLKVGDSVKIKDLVGNNTTDAGLIANIYEVVDEKEIPVDTMEIDKFKVVDENGKTIKAILPLNGLKESSVYVLRFESPVFEISKKYDSWDQDKEIVKDGKDGYYKFVFKANGSNRLPIIIGLESNIESITFNSSSQFESFDSSRPLFVRDVWLTEEKLNSDPVEIARKKVNKYYACGNFDDIKKELQNTVIIDKDNTSYRDLMTTGIDVSDVFLNIPSGEYKIHISISGYNDIEVPVDNNIKLTGLNKGSYEVTSKITHIKNNCISGIIRDKIKKTTISSVVDIVVLNSKGLVVAVGKSNSEGYYEILDGTGIDDNYNKLVVGEIYTMVFRTRNYGVTDVKNVVFNVADKKVDVEMQKGTTTGFVSEITTNDNNKQAITSDTDVYAIDSYYVFDEDSNFATKDLRKMYNKEITYKGCYALTRDDENTKTWNGGPVVLGTYRVYVKGNTMYEDTVSDNSITVTDDGSDCVINGVRVNMVILDDDIPVSVNLIKTNTYDNNYGGVDTIRVYEVVGSEERYINTYRVNSKKEQLISIGRLYPGHTYKIYVYSRNYKVDNSSGIFTINDDSTTYTKEMYLTSTSN